MGLLALWEVANLAGFLAQMLDRPAASAADDRVVSR
jgi:hypothetical protein